MKRSSIIVVSLAAAAALTISAVPTGAQDSATSGVSAPVLVKPMGSAASKKNSKGDWLKAEVIHFDSNSIIVREDTNEKVIHTFTYAPELKGKMQQISDRGGYQYGDKVKILYQPGQTVALKVLGKPSKPL